MRGKEHVNDADARIAADGRCKGCKDDNDENEIMRGTLTM
jgi:hypothetical protein